MDCGVGQVRCREPTVVSTEEGGERILICKTPRSSSATEQAHDLLEEDEGSRLMPRVDRL